VNNQKRFFLIITAVLVLVATVLVIVSAIITFLFIRWPLSSDEAISESTALSMAAPQHWDDLYSLSISSKILQWLEDFMRDERGAYNFNANCGYDEHGQVICDGRRSSNRTGAVVMWANHRYWQKTLDTRELGRIAAALEIYSNRDVVQSIETDDLGCFYLLPLIFDENLSQTMREQAADICLRTSYEAPTHPSTFADSEPDTYKHQSYNLIANIISGANNPLEPLNLSLPELTFMSMQNNPNSSTPHDLVTPTPAWADFAADLASQYQVGRSPAILEIAYYYLSGALAVYVENPNNLDVKCPLILASQQFCQIANDNINPSCHLARFLISHVEQAIEEPNLNLRTAAKCAISTPALQDRFLSKMKVHYNSTENSHFQPFDNFWLLNDSGSASKSVITNALFAGLLVSK